MRQELPGSLGNPRGPGNATWLGSSVVLCRSSDRQRATCQRKDGDAVSGAAERERLLAEIQRRKEILVDLIQKGCSFTDRAVLSQSRALDRLILAYHRLGDLGGSPA